MIRGETRIVVPIRDVAVPHARRPVVPRRPAADAGFPNTTKPPRNRHREAEKRFVISTMYG